MTEPEEQCPTCFSENVNRIEVTRDDHHRVIECECVECGACWEES